MSKDIIYWTWSKCGESLLKSPKIVKEEKEETPSESPPANITEERFVEQNKREQNYNKIAARHLMSRGNINPFHIKNNYVDDISVQDNFLRPKYTNQE